MIHQYKLGGYNIVLDICSGSVHAVDEVAYDIIALFEEKSREEVLAEIEAKYSSREDITKEDIAECYADPTLAYNVLGWRAEYGIDDMCRDAANWQKQNPNGYDE